MKKPVKRSVAKVTNKPRLTTQARPTPSSLKQTTKTPDTKVSAEASRTEQCLTFEQGMSYFHRREYGKAKEVFAQAISGPSTEMSHAALMYIRMCERRLGGSEPKLDTPEDHYNYGTSLLNQRRLEEAEPHLRKAIAGNKNAGHHYYTLALCCGLRGNIPEAAQFLKRAIELEPGSRVAALNDIEFQSIASQPAIREILSERRNAG
jgi:tetratricopeptide (TPR) repeat protein